ncbi:MAG TPA: hypothetical protein GX720_01885 [Clostridiaceae bacterium]|nr:hypothetical protein [Clostridiaceae bacterium]
MSKEESQEKRLKKMNRADLVEVINELSQRESRLKAENMNLRKQLENKRLRLEDAGSIAEATLSLHAVFETAQRAADHYLEEVRQNHAEAEEQAERIVSEARYKADKMLEDTSAECRQMLQQTTEDIQKKLSALTSEIEKEIEAKVDFKAEEEEAED